LSQANIEIELVMKISGGTDTNPSPSEVWSLSPVQLKKKMYTKLSNSNTNTNSNSVTIKNSH